MKRIGLLFFISYFLFNHAVAQVSLNGEWDFQLNGGTWNKILVPGNWEMQGFDTPKYGKELVKSTAIYRRNFTAPAAWKDLLVRITFEGVNFGYTFKINGQEAGSHHGAFNQRVFDITPLVKLGQENQIEVTVETRPRAYLFDVSDDWALSGISRPVHVDAIPKNHIEDVTIKTNLQGSDAQVSVEVKTEGNRGKVEGFILDADGKQVSKLSSHPSPLTSHLQAPHLWTAETPYLYTLKLQLKDGKKVLHSYQTKFGVREVTWNNQVFRINGKPVKLKGVNHHDLSPVHGRAITREEMEQDMELMKAANINAIRMCHYPPIKYLLELADSLGMYVIDEVPYNFGTQWLGKKEYLKDLKERAYYTVNRDKNHPSIVVWSVGNENPITDIGLETGRYVYSLDNTRPYVFPQTHKPFAKMIKADYDSITMYSAHYPDPTELRKWSKETRYAIMNTEYAHALGLDFGQMQDCVEKWYQHPQLAGGGVWMLFDQGILRKSDKPVSKNDYTEYAWLDAHTYYDTDGDQGADGITYSNRLPQTDYWQVRKVYAPVKMSVRSYKSGKLLMRFINRYDFDDLSKTKIYWTLHADGQQLKQGALVVACAPHDTTSMTLEGIRFPQGQIGYITFTAKDKHGRQVTEQTFRLDKMNNLDTWHHLAQQGSKDLFNKDRLLSWVQKNVYARTGKKKTMSEYAAERQKKQLWPTNLVACTKAEVTSANTDSIVVKAAFVLNDTCSVDGSITFKKGMQHELLVNYNLTAHGEGVAAETGLSMLQEGATGMRWGGQGPYPTYPSKNLLSEFGFWQLNSDDLYFPGNRQHTCCLLMTNDKGEGTAIIPADDAANISVERYPQGIVMSHNAYVAKPYNKAARPKCAKLNGLNIKGQFTLVAVDSNWSVAMQQILGTPTRKVESYAPFYHSYDQ